MTDFYTVLRSALDKVGAADSEQRDRVYEHVREVMVRKLRNHRPPVGETEIASRVVSFEAAIDRIESEIAEEEQAAIADSSLVHSERLQQVGGYHPAGYDEGLGPSESYDDGGPISDADSDRGDDRYADPDIPHSPESPGELAPLEAGPEAPEPMWGVPAIDMAWDETREQWRDARRPPDPFANDANVRVSEGSKSTGRAGRPSAGRPGGLIRWAKMSRRGGNAPPPSTESPPDGEPDEDFIVQTARSRRRRPGGRVRVRGWFGQLWPTSRRRPELDDKEDRDKSDGGERLGRRGASGSADRRRRSKARVKKDEARAQRRGRTKESDDDPIAELARKLKASRGGYERSEPLLLAPSPASNASGRFLPSPERIEENEQEEQHSQEPPRRHRGRLFGGAGGGETIPDEGPATAPTPLGLDVSEQFEPEDEPRIRRRARSRRGARENRGARRAQTTAASGQPLQRRGRRGLWIGIVFVLGAGIIAWSASVFLPVLFPSDPDSETPALPAAAATLAAPATPLVVSSGGIVLFDGIDPSVFEGAADNPTNYLADVGGGIVRITSTINSGGARLAIGPDAANSLAGHQVRLVMEARGTPDQAAAAVRLAYQQDLIILDWRLARLIGEFAIIAATWTIPSREAEGTDYLIIEPGVAGDGTAIDVRSIRFELLD